MLLNIDNENFETSSDLQKFILLSELPIQLMKENLQEQINSPLSLRNNYLEVIFEKAQAIKEMYPDDIDTIMQINDLVTYVCSFVLDQINEVYDICINYENDDIVKLQEKTSIIYNYLILRYKKNINKFIYKYIIKHKKSLVESFETGGKRKDVTSLSLKKQIKNKDDIGVVSNITPMVKHIINLNVDPEIFIDYSFSDGYYEGCMMQDFYRDCEIVGSFIPKYFDLLVDDYEEVLDEIIMSVKTKIIQKGK